MLGIVRILIASRRRMFRLKSGFSGLIFRLQTQVPCIKFERYNVNKFEMSVWPLSLKVGSENAFTGFCQKIGTPDLGLKFEVRNQNMTRPGATY